MRLFFAVFLIAFFVFVADAQPKRSGKVKRKYRNVEAVNENLPQVYVHGRVRNLEREPIQGATVVVPGTRLGVNTNESGEYFLQGLPTGKVSIMVSYAGYRTKIIDYYLQEGNNDVYFTLDRDHVVIESVTVTAQQREQQVMDIPVTMSSLSGRFLESVNLTENEQIADFVPGMNARIQTPHRPTYVIRGLTSDEVSPNAQPRVSVYFNHVPVSRSSMAVTELYDMDRVEVLKGPQGTLFGRGSQIGAISMISRKPQYETGGYLTAGFGEYAQKEIQGALNLPVIKNRLSARVSGIYSYRDGYVENTFGGKLNGRNTTGGRFSLRFSPGSRTKMDLVVNYQLDDNPGVAFMSKRLPNAEGVTDIFRYRASLEQGKNLFNKREVLGTSLDIKHFKNENNYWSFLTSWYANTADSRWDGDGTHAPAIDMAESVNVKQFTQEIRYNFSRKSRTNGFFGASIWGENVDQSYWFGPNEQYMAYLFLQMPQYLVNPGGNTFPMAALPNDPQLGPLAGMPLPDRHEEENMSRAKNRSFDIFADATWKLRPRLSFTAGVRGVFEHSVVTNSSAMTGGQPSALGMLTGNYPNLFFKPVSETQVSRNFLSYTWRGNFKYDFSSYSGVYLGYAKGRRPRVIQFNTAGQHEVMKEEAVHSFDAGLKFNARQRYWFDAGVFYQLYRNFQTTAWDSVSVNYLIRDAGMATSYGAEASMKAALFSFLDVFGNYAYIHARFDENDSRGNEQEYAGNHFRLSPEHSFAAGVHLRIPLNRYMHFFAVPSYAWKSHVWFEDANTPGLEQEAYGLLNARAGIEMKGPDLTLACTGSNLLNERYVISAGNTGTMFGVPTFVPGAPRMLGMKLTWKF